MINRNSIIFSISLLLLGGTFIIWHSKIQFSTRYDYDSEIIQDQAKTPPVSVPATLTSPGFIPLNAKSEGIVTKINVKPGEYVLKNQLLVTLDVSPEELESYASVRKNSAAMEIFNPEAALNSIKTLEKVGFYNRAESEDARLQAMKNIKEYIALRTSLDDYEKRTLAKLIVAPFDGFVSEINWRVGDYVQPSRQLVPGISLYRPGQKLEARMEVPDELIGKLAPGQSVELWSPMGLDKPLKGTISSLSMSAYQTDKGRYFVGTATMDYSLPYVRLNQHQRAQVSQSDYQIGMRLMANIKTEPFKKGVWIPREATDLLLPEEAIDSTISYLNGKKEILVSSRERSKREKSGSDSLRANKLGLKPSPVVRSIATLGTPNENKISEIYLLSSDGKVTRVKVKLGPQNNEQVFLAHSELKGARVITHYKPRIQMIQILSKSGE